MKISQRLKNFHVAIRKDFSQARAIDRNSAKQNNGYGRPNMRAHYRDPHKLHRAPNPFARRLQFWKERYYIPQT